MTEECGKYCVSPNAAPEPSPLTTEALIAKAHANHQGLSYETGDQLLARLPERLRALADLILGGKMGAGDVAYAVAALIDQIEHAPGEENWNRH
jgi:hypothetical protein